MTQKKWSKLGSLKVNKTRFRKWRTRVEKFSSPVNLPDMLIMNKQNKNNSKPVREGRTRV